jgi:hypothetical protein
VFANPVRKSISIERLESIDSENMRKYVLKSCEYVSISLQFNTGLFMGVEFSTMK